MNKRINRNVSTTILRVTPVQSPVHWMRFSRIAWYVAALLTVITIILAIPGYLKTIHEGYSIVKFAVNSSPLVIATNVFTVFVSLSTALLSLFLSSLLFRQGANDHMALFLSFYLLAFSVSVGPFEELGTILGAKLINIIWAGVFTPLIVYPASCFLFILFPDGRFAVDWSRWLALASLITAPLSALAYFILEYSSRRLIVPMLVISALQLAVMLGVLYALFYRYRHIASGQQRQQIKWIFYGLGILLFFQIASSYPYFWSLTLPVNTLYPVSLALGMVFYISSFTAIPISLTIAVMRYRLYEIDIIINRTLVYGVLTASTMGIYVVSVGYLGNLFQVQNRSIIAFLATGLVALLFQPLRERLQSAVNRLMYGERNEPVSVLSKLGKQLENTPSPRDALDGMVATIAQTLKLPYVAIELSTGDAAQTVADIGHISGETIRFPIGYQNQIIGSILVAPRSPGEPFGEKDNLLLENIAGQAGAVVQAAKLTADLQRSRQNLITAREEERRRLRRDLHDGIGPTMAGQTLKVEAAIDLILGDSPNGRQPDLEEAVKLLKEVKEQTQETVKNIRHIVYALRPPSLDDLGLVPAIQAHIDQLSVSRLGLAITLETSDQAFPRLSAAVEVAAYRIVLEAITNVIKHAHAQNCVVKLSIPGSENRKLFVEIQDDGKGLPKEKPPGVGLASIRERVEELDGSFTIVSDQINGTRVLAQIPIGSMEK